MAYIYTKATNNPLEASYSHQLINTQTNPIPKENKQALRPGGICPRRDDDFTTYFSTGVYNVRIGRHLLAAIIHIFVSLPFSPAPNCEREASSVGTFDLWSDR